MKKLLIDTDIGDDIDDALAIAYALNSPDLEVVGITTVFRDAALRARIVRQQLHRWGRGDIPVAVGAGRPLLAGVDMGVKPAHWVEGLPEAPDSCAAFGPDFIIEALGRHPNTAIAAIAPLTNLALAACKAPEVMEQAEIWIMGGMYSRSYNEWNIRCDPEAAQIVLDRCKRVRILGLDVTLQCRMPPLGQKAPGGIDEREALLLQWMGHWQSEAGYAPILHDPLVVQAIEQPGLVRFEPKCIYIERGGINPAYSRGHTVEMCNPFGNFAPPAPNVEMAVAVDGPRASRLFMERVFPTLAAGGTG